MARGEWQPVNVSKALVQELKEAFSRDLEVVGLSFTALVNRLLSSAVEESKEAVSFDRVLQSLSHLNKEQLNEVVLVALYEMYVRPTLAKEGERAEETKLNGDSIALACWRKLVGGEALTPQEVIKLAAFLEVDPCELNRLVSSLPIEQGAEESSDPTSKPPKQSKSQDRRKDGPGTV